MSKPVLGILGFSDGDPAAHKMLAPIVQAQIDAIVDALTADGRVEVVVAEDIVHSDKTAKAYAEDLKAKGVDATVFAYGVFAFPVFSVIAARYGKGPFLLAAPFNPDWPGMVSMLAAGGGLAGSPRDAGGGGGSSCRRHELPCGAGEGRCRAGARGRAVPPQQRAGGGIL